ncbi:MAG: hypothetical protein ACRDA3_05910 [Peptostreptococcaceae bacterium]
MKNKIKKDKNDYKSIAYQINNKKTNINKEARQSKLKLNNKENLKQSEELDKSAFVMVPINHPKISEIIKLLNEIDNKAQNIQDQNDNSKPRTNFKLIITLNDILTNFSKDKIIIPENSIISPLAKDYINQKKIEVEYVKN